MSSTCRAFLLFVVLLAPRPVVSTAQPTVVVTEILYNGNDLLSLGELEWIEVYNAGADTVDLQGWTVRDPSPALLESGTHVVQASVEIAPGEYAVLCASNPSSLPCDYTYSGVNLSTPRDELVLSTASGVEVDRIAYGTAGWPSPREGRPIVYTGTTGADNDDGSAWAVASRRLGYLETGGNAGSPRLRGPLQRTPVVTSLSGPAGWRFLAPPTSGRTVADVARQIHVQGVTGARPSGAPNLFLSYRNAETSISNQFWTPAEDVTDALEPGRGYLAYVYGTDLPTTLVFGGPGPSGDVAVSGLPDNQQFHYLGNPFPNAFDLDGLDLVAQGFQAAVQVWDPHTGTRQQSDGTTISGSYRILMPISGVGANVNDDLAAQQGFLVERSAPQPGSSTSTLTFDADGQAPTRAPFYKNADARSSAQNPAGIQFTLSIEDAGQTVVQDRAAMVLFHPRATRSRDPWDASKLAPVGTSSGAVALAGTEDGGAARAVASYPRDLGQRIRLPLHVTRPSTLSGRLVLSWTLIGHVPASWDVRLDVNGTSVNLRTQSHVVLPRGTASSVPKHATTASPFQPKPLRFAVDADPESAVVLHAGPSTLPVELVSFRAEPDGRDVRLHWTTASETGNAGFRVLDVTAGEPVERRFVAGNGSSTSSSSYTVRLPDVEPGTHRYRLVQQDVDGATTPLGTREVRVMPDAGLTIRVHPNPIRETGAILAVPGVSGHLHLSLFDLLGRHVATLHDAPVQRGTTIRRSLSGTGRAAGIYFVRGRLDGHTVTHKVVLTP